MASKNVSWTHNVNGAFTSSPASEVRNYSFDLSSLTFVSMTITGFLKFHNYTGSAQTATMYIGFKNVDSPYNSTGLAYSFSVTVPAATDSDGKTTFTVSVPNATLAARNITYGDYRLGSTSDASRFWAYIPVIKSITRTYSIPVPSAGEKITHANLKAFSTWCNMTAVNHTTSYTDIRATESNRPWGTSANLRQENGTSVTTVSSLAKTAGAKIEASWINTSAYALCDARSWSQ